MARLRVIRPHWEFLSSCGDARFVVLYGGASSGKSWSLAAHLCRKLYSEPGVGVIALRKTRPAVRKSCLRLIRHWLDEWKWPYRQNLSDLTITAPNGSFIQFDGLDDAEKIKSIEGINYVWMEEATEFTHREFLQLNLRCRAHNLEGVRNQVFCSFNPVDPVGNEWLENLSRQKPEGICLGAKLRVFHCTHTYNPFLSKEEHDTIEALADTDEEYNKIYRLGLWATPTAIIFTNWDIVGQFPVWSKLDDIAYGLDFGYVNPTALVRVGFRESDVYIQEMLYESKVHNADLIARLGRLIHQPHAVIIADSAEPAYIQEIADAGWNVHPTNKAEGQGGKSFVATGIDRVKRYRLHITADSVNVIGEIRGYKWREDRAGNVLPEPVKFRDHAMDAIRYVVGSQPEPVATEVLQIPDWLRAQLQGEF